MKKLFNLIILLVVAFPFMSKADNYKSLWKQAQMASEKDQPRTEIGILKKIANMAESRHDYGQLLAAESRTISLWGEISSDSLLLHVLEMEKKAMLAEKKDKVLASVYYAVIGKFYKDNYSFSKQNDSTADQYFIKALKYPELLALQKSVKYNPIIVKGRTGYLYNNDLLHVIGYESENYKLIHDYYVKVGNRRSACISAQDMLSNEYEKASWNEKDAKRSKILTAIDSCIQVYQDLPEAGELAIAHFDLIRTDEKVSAKEKIEYIDYALKKWGTWFRMNELRNARMQLINPIFEISIPYRTTILPDRQFVFYIDKVRNLKSVKLTISRLKADATTDLRMDDAKHLNAVKALASSTNKIVLTKQFDGIPDYQEVKDSFVIAGLKPGAYLVEASSSNEKVGNDYGILYVTDVAMISEKLPEEKMRYAIVSATTGQPLKGAHLQLKKENHFGKARKPEIKTFTADDKGEVIVSAPGFTEARAWTDDDKYCLEDHARGYYTYYGPSSTNHIAEVYTDRSIYRPGQKVQVAVISFATEKGRESKVEANKQLLLYLNDANGKEIEKKQVVTDEYGTATVDFQLPSSGLTGRYSVYTNVGSGSTYFQVDEYKRPTFEVNFPKVDQKYSVGDTIIVKGTAKTYAGVPIQGAKVSYRIVRNPSLWWRSFLESPKTVKDDTTIVADDGTFSVAIPLTVDNPKDKQARFYHFSVTATVTDVAGESHAGELTIPLGTKSTAFSCDLAEKILKDSLKTIKFKYCNASGVDIPGDVSFRIDGGSVIKAEANQEVSIASFSFLSSGKHYLEAICGNDTLKQNFVIFSMEDTKPVEVTHDWFYQSARTFKDNHTPVYIQVGSSDENVHLLYNVFSGKKIIEQGTCELSNELLTKKFTYQEEYGTGLRVTFAWIKEGQFYTHSVEIQQPEPDKELKLEWSTFRDHLVPGQKETWTLKIKDSQNKPAKAQMMSVLYDKSLDQLEKHSWNIDLGLYNHIPSASWDALFCNTSFSLSRRQEYNWLSYKDLESDHFSSDFFDGTEALAFREESNVKYAASVIKKDAMVLAAKPLAAKQTLMFRKQPANDLGLAYDSENASESSGKSQSSASANQMRENLNETAFFYPNVESDDEGNISLKFTLPESLTTWRFMGLAHDKDMKYGMLEGEAVASKKVMVQPNMPRFLREGDEAVIASKVTNTTEKIQKGTAKIELIDPETNKVIYTKSQKYTLQPNSTQSIAFPVSQKEGIYIARISVSGKEYSDGEQQYLAVLSNKELVLNTLPVTLHHKGDTIISLSQLYGKQNGKVNVSGYYYSTPSWLMIQSLPSVSNPNEDNAISLATAFYSNTIARSILTSKPIIKQVFEQWKQEKDGSSLMSALEKNQDLKTLVLSETPWVADADKEASQKKELINYFDENLINNRLENQYNKLRQLQHPDGSFSWWPGMKGSQYMTEAVAEILVRLNAMSSSKQFATLLDKAFNYLQGQIHTEVAEMKKEKNQKNVYVSESALHYLYILSLDGRKLNTQGGQDYNYLISKLDLSGRGYTILGKARMAIVLAKCGKMKEAKEFLQSISEYSVYREDYGRYYDARKAYYSWSDYKIPTEVAAIEAYAMLDKKGNAQTIEEMQRWLLQQKRSQSWDTPYNTVNAVSAFMVDEHFLGSNEETLPVIKFDNKDYTLPKASVGLGYFRMDIDGTPKKMFVNKPNSGTSWGAIFAQYLQDTKDVEAASSGISIKREMLADKMEVGSKVKVRITINCDRDYDFVQVIDKRAACLEPVSQLSGYQWGRDGGYYLAPRDNSTNYYFDGLSKGEHIVETEYYIDRIGVYNSGTCTVQCAYAPEFSGRTTATTLNIAK